MLRRWWPVLFLALMPLIPLWRAVFVGEAIGAFDQIRQMAPWNGPAPDQPWDVLQADSVLQFYPWRDMVFEAWSRLELPLWNPYELAGAPLLANSQSAGFYPPHILMGVLHVPTAAAMTFLAWLHLFWAGLGVYALCRRLGATDVGAVVGGVSFSLSAFMLAWTALPSVISTCAWIPWCLWAVYGIHRLEREDSMERAESPEGIPLQPVRPLHPIRAFSALAICTAMMLLAGHLQFAAYGLLAIALTAVTLFFTSRYDELKLVNEPITMDEVDRETGVVIEREMEDRGGLRTVRRFRWGGLATCIGALVVGGMLAAPQLLPVMEFSKWFHRRAPATEEGYQAYIGGAIKPFELANLLHPKLLGDPRQFSGMPVLQGLSAYWPPLAKQGANLAESAVTIGPLVLGLLFFVPWRDRRAWPLAILGALALLLAFGTVLNKPLYFLLPGWSSTGSPGRIIVLFILAACITASLGLSSNRLKSGRFLVLGGLAAGLLVAIACIALAPTIRGFEADHVDDPMRGLILYTLATAAPTLLISIVLAAISLWMAMAKTTWLQLGAAVAIPAVLGIGFLMTGQPLAKLPPLDKNKRVAIVNQDWELLVPAKATLPPNLAGLSRIHELGGYDSLLHRDMKAALDAINGGDSAPPANGNMMFIKPSSSGHWEELAWESGVSEVWSGKELEEFKDWPVRHEDGLYKYSMDTPRDSVVPRAQQILSEGYDHVTIKATIREQGDRALLMDSRLPGWTATIDGKPGDLRSNENFIGMWVEPPPGEHTVEFRYEPPGLRTGLMLCGVGLIGLVGPIGLNLIRKRRS